MEGVYDIMLGGRPVGQAAVFRKGLYLYFDCRCRLSGETVCRIRVKCGEAETDLGIPVPEGREFVLRTKKPVKGMGTGVPEFWVMPNRVTLPENWVPVRAEEPFAYLTRLQDAFLEVRDGQVGISFREGSEALSPPPCL